MVDIFLTGFCFFGFIYAANRWLRIDVAFAPIFSASLIGVLLYGFAILNQLQTGTLVLIFSGWLFSISWIMDFLRTNKGNYMGALFPLPAFFIALILISFAVTLKMQFTVVDDYVYWGIMGKYLYINNHLPVAGCPLDTRILAYTPGTSLFHYFFYRLAGHYSVHLSYFAQNMILISALFVVVKKETIKKSIIYMAVLIVLMTVFYGSVFSKLQVDYLLATFCFSIFWIYYTEKNTGLRLLTLSMPICFLFLIKEIGFVLQLFILALIFFDLCADSTIDRKKRLKAMMGLLLTGIAVFLIRTLWTTHVDAMGFKEFHTAINWDSIKTTFHIFSDIKVQKGFLIFIKDVFFGSADRLNLPYLVWYGILFFLGFKLLKGLTGKERSRVVLFCGLVLSFFFVYLFLLYCQQIIIFKIGTSFDHTIGFSRYLNIVFSQIVFISFITFFHTSVFKNRDVKKTTSIWVIGIVLLVIGFSRGEIYLRQEDKDVQIQRVSEQIMDKMDTGIHSVGIVSDSRDDAINLQFLYHLLPNKVDYRRKTFKTEKALMKHVLNYDYIIVFNPDPPILDWLAPYISGESKADRISLLRVRQDPSQKERTKKISLEKILL